MITIKLEYGGIFNFESKKFDSSPLLLYTERSIQSQRVIVTEEMYVVGTELDDLLSKTTLLGGKLVWLEKTKRGYGKGSAVSYDQAISECGFKDAASAKQTLTIATNLKKEKQREEKMAGLDVPRTELRSLESELKTKAIEYLKKYVRIHFRDKKICAYTYENDKLELFETGFLPKTSIEMTEFLNALQRIKPDAYAKVKNEIDDKIDGALDKYLEAKRSKVPDFPTIMLHAYQQAALDHSLGIVIPADLPIIAWGKDALLRLDTNLLRPGPYPAFRAFLERVNFPEELMRFVWKLFDPEDTGRQIVWSQSLGHSGQSTFWNCIFNKLEKVGVSLNQVRYQDKHTESKCYLKRFVVFPDCDNRRMYETNLVKKLSGADVGDIDFKHAKSFSAKIYARIVAHSNMAPELDTTNNAMKTRLLYFILKPFPQSEAKTSSEISSIYDDQFWHFLHACKKLDEKRGGGHIPVPPAMWESIRVNCDLPIRNMARSFVNRYVVPDPLGEVIKEDLWKEFLIWYKQIHKGLHEKGQALAQKDMVYQAFDNLVYAKLDVTKEVTRENSVGLKVYQGIKLLPIDVDEVLKELEQQRNSSGRSERPATAVDAGLEDPPDDEEGEFIV